MGKHTPGPWMLEGSWSIDSDGLGGWVSTIHPSPLFALDPILGTPESIIANARLIAAAPELLKALTELLDAFECDPDDLPPHEYEAITSSAKFLARVALSKAGV